MKIIKKEKKNYNMKNNIKKNYKTTSTSKEKNRIRKMNNIIHNKRRKNSLRLKEIYTYEKNNSYFNSEEVGKTDFNRKINEFDNIKDSKNKNEFTNNLKLINTINTISNRCLKKKQEKKVIPK